VHVRYLQYTWAGIECITRAAEFKTKVPARDRYIMAAVGSKQSGTFVLLYKLQLLISVFFFKKKTTTILTCIKKLGLLSLVADVSFTISLICCEIDRWDWT
jgi:hypothetical protein